MAKAIPNPEPPRNGNAFDQEQPAQREQIKRPGGLGHPPALEPWSTEDLLLSATRGRKEPETQSLLNSLDTGVTPVTNTADASLVIQLQGEIAQLQNELAQLQAENAQIQAELTHLQTEVGPLQTENDELRSIITDLENEMQAAAAKEPAPAAEQDPGWADRQKEYESLIDEKTELIRSLHLTIQELQETSSRPAVPREDELLSMSEELERERCQLQQERRQLDEEMRQLKEDGDIMTEEMRKMEMQMSRERADLARQRSDLTRLNEEIRHELERLDKDGGLGARLAELQQRHRDVLKAGPGGGRPSMISSAPQQSGRPPQPRVATQLAIDLDADPGEGAPPAPPAAPGSQASQGSGPRDPKKKDSGLFRRLFGKEGQ